MPFSTKGERLRKAAEWLAHLQGWKASGQSLATYARTHGLAQWALYHRRTALIGEGRWHEPPKAGRTGGPAVPLRFARVTVEDSPRTRPFIVRVVLVNGRRADMELSDTEHLADILSALERRT